MVRAVGQAGRRLVEGPGRPVPRLGLPAEGPAAAAAAAVAVLGPLADQVPEELAVAAAADP